MRNVHAKMEERSSYAVRHGEECTGLRLLLGVGVFYYPSPTMKTLNSKFEPRLHYGIFMGVVLDPRLRHNGVYSVMDLSVFRNCDLHHAAALRVSAHIRKPQWTRMVRKESHGWRFPLALRHGQDNNTLEGIKAHYDDEDDQFEYIDDMAPKPSQISELTHRMHRICNKVTELERLDALDSAYHEDTDPSGSRESSAQTVHTPKKFIKLKRLEFHVGQDKSMANVWA